MTRLCTVASGLFLWLGTTMAQRPAFEVASIKQNKSGRDGGSVGPRGDRLAATNVPLNALLSYAYAPAKGVLLKTQIVGAPDWAGTDHFDIQAKLEGEARTLPIEQTKLMLVSLLEDRFQLKAHRETRDLPVYNLVLIKRGPKLSADQTPPDAARSFIEFTSKGREMAPLPRGAMRMNTGDSGTTLSGTAIPVSRIVSLLQGQSDRMILDKTGFTGLVDIHLEFSQPAATSQPAESAAPSLFTAIQDIGLHLESARAPIEILVIDSVHKPSEN
jgi:uncharacterized protein (TIGR03435 family)